MIPCRKVGGGTLHGSAGQAVRVWSLPQGGLQPGPRGARPTLRCMSSAFPQPPIAPLPPQPIWSVSGPFSRHGPFPGSSPSMTAPSRPPSSGPAPCSELSGGSSCPEPRLLGSTAYLTRVATVTAPRAVPASPWSPGAAPHLPAWLAAAVPGCPLRSLLGRGAKPRQHSQLCFMLLQDQWLRHGSEKTYEKLLFPDSRNREFRRAVQRPFTSLTAVTGRLTGRHFVLFPYTPNVDGSSILRRRLRELGQRGAIMKGSS